MNDQDLASLSGETTYRAPKPLELNEVSLNGDDRDGGYFRKRVLIGKPKDQKPEEINLGKTVTVVFLKIRRKLIERGKDGQILRSTSEHNAKTDAVTLFDAKTGERINGVAADLRTQFEGLRTVQIVYALLVTGTGEPELVKLNIKGASLGSEAKPKDILDFYSYLASFPKDEHIWEYKTILSPLLEKGQRSYYAIHFQRGEKLADKSLEFAVHKLKDVAAKCAEIDASRASRIVKSTPADGVVADTSVDASEPVDEINPDDIPF